MNILTSGELLTCRIRKATKKRIRRDKVPDHGTAAFIEGNSGGTVESLALKAATAAILTILEAGGQPYP